MAMKAPGSTTNPGLFILRLNVFWRQGRVEAFTLIIGGIVPSIETKQSPGDVAEASGPPGQFNLDDDQRTPIERTPMLRTPMERAICTTPLSL